MRRFGVQMIDGSVPPRWWRAIMGHFASVGDPFEIRCWREETAEIREASRCGTAAEERNEVSIRGTVTEALLEAWLTEEPAEKSVYNKMTRYFTIHVANARCDLWSEHYGTELVIEIQTDADIAFFEQVMGQDPECFSVGEF